MSRRTATLAVTLALASMLAAPSQASKREQAERLGNAADVVKEILTLPEGIPADILDPLCKVEADESPIDADNNKLLVIAAVAGLGSRKPLSAIASCALTMFPDQLVFIVQELHHFQRAWGGPNPRRFCRAHPVAAPEQ